MKTLAAVPGAAVVAQKVSERSRRGPRAANADTGPGPAPTGPLRIAVIGTGCVGLVTAACLAQFGHEVVALDIDAERVAALQRTEVMLYETGLAERVAQQVEAGRLRFTTDAEAALPHAALVFVAVGTPARDDGGVGLEAIAQVTALLCAMVRAPTVVVLKSTVPVGTADGVRRALAASHADLTGAHDVPSVLSNPEFLREGSAVRDFLAPDRIIVGSDDSSGAAAAVLLQAYRPLVEAGVPVLAMDTRSAELAKCAANAMLAARISFVNEIAAIAEATGADIERVCEGIGSDRRIGRECLRPGLGYGGSCFPKDVAALRYTARQHQLRSDVLAATERVNGRQRNWPLEALRRDLGGWSALRGLNVALWGLAFKPGTDDMREAPSLTLIERLRHAGALLTVYDPAAMPKARALLGADHGIRWCASAQSALEGADVLLLVTEWPEFVAFEPQCALGALRLRTVFDGRNALDAGRWRGAGLRLFQVGRPDRERVLLSQLPQRTAGSAIATLAQQRDDAGYPAWVQPFASAAR